MKLVTMTVLMAAAAAELPVRWDELTAGDWASAQEKAAYTCVLPVGILEKHGPHVPLGSDLIHAREWAARAARQEYAVVFPEVFFGQIWEARHQPGAVAFPTRVAWDALEATCDEIGRNGFRKILIVNGHGGNTLLLRYFTQTRIERPRDYAVFFFDPAPDAAFAEKMQAARRSDPAGDMHAGENETSSMLFLRPDLVRMDAATSESGENLRRLPLTDLSTAIWWYAGFPNHYAGEGAKATAEYGRLLTENRVERLVQALRAVKADTRTLPLQREFHQRVVP